MLVDPTHKSTKTQQNSGGYTDPTHKTTDDGNKQPSYGGARDYSGWWNQSAWARPFSQQNMGYAQQGAQTVANWAQQQGQGALNALSPIGEGIQQGVSEIAKPLGPAAHLLGGLFNAGYNALESTGIPGGLADVAEGAKDIAGSGISYLGEGINSGLESTERTIAGAVEAVENPNIPWYAKPLGIVGPGQGALGEIYPEAKKDIEAAREAAPWVLTETLTPMIEAGKEMAKAAVPTNARDAALRLNPITGIPYSAAANIAALPGAISKGREEWNTLEYRTAKERISNGESVEEVMADIPVNMEAELAGGFLLDPLNPAGEIIAAGVTGARAAKWVREYATKSPFSIEETSKLFLAEGHQVKKVGDVAEGIEAALKGAPQKSKVAKLAGKLNPLGRPNSTKATLMMEEIGDTSNFIQSAVKGKVTALAENADILATYAENPIMARADELLKAGNNVDDTMMQLAPDIAKYMSSDPEVLVPLAGLRPVSNAGRKLSVVMRELDNSGAMAKLAKQMDNIRQAPVSEAAKAEVIAAAQKNFDDYTQMMERMSKKAIAEHDIENGLALAEKALDIAKKAEIITPTEKADQLLLAMAETMWGSTQKFYPVEKIGTLKKAQNAVNNFLSVYAFMGYNPAYAIRNAASNVTHLMFDGLMTFDDSAKLMDDMDRFVGFVPKAARREIVGAAGTAAPKNTSAPFLKLSNKFEQDASTRAVVQSLRNSWNTWQRPSIPHAIAAALPQGIREDLMNRLNLAKNEKEAYSAAKELLKGRESWRYVTPDLMTQLRNLNDGLADEVQNIVDSAYDKNALEARIERLQGKAARKADDTLHRAEQMVAPEQREIADAIDGSVAKKQLTKKEAETLKNQSDFMSVLDQNRAKIDSVREAAAKAADDSPITESVSDFNRTWNEVRDLSDEVRGKVDNKRIETLMNIDNGGNPRTLWPEYFEFRDNTWTKEYWEPAEKALRDCEQRIKDGKPRGYNPPVAPLVTQPKPSSPPSGGTTAATPDVAPSPASGGIQPLPAGKTAQDIANAAPQRTDELRRLGYDVTDVPVVADTARLKKEAQVFGNGNRWGGEKAKTGVRSAWNKYFSDYDAPANKKAWEALPDNIKQEWSDYLDGKIAEKAAPKPAGEVAAQAVQPQAVDDLTPVVGTPSEIQSIADLDNRARFTRAQEIANALKTVEPSPAEEIKDMFKERWRYKGDRLNDVLAEQGARLSELTGGMVTTVDNDVRAAVDLMGDPTWAKTQKEFLDKRFGTTGNRPPKKVESAKLEHRMAVSGALGNDMPVPLEVIADYPGILKTHPELRVPAQPVAQAVSETKTLDDAINAWVARESSGAGSFDLHAIKKSAEKYKKLAKKFDDGAWHSFDEIATPKTRQTLGRELTELRDDMDYLQVAWDNYGNPYHAKPGVPVPEWLTQIEDESVMAALPSKGDVAKTAVQPQAITKQPWEMTLDEYSPTVPTRPVRGREVSFEQWLEGKGIDPKSLPTESEQADAIGSALFYTPNRTGAQAGKEGSLQKRLAKLQDLRNQYYTEVPEIETGTRALDLDRQADLAYARVSHKREIRAALAEGKPVPAEVLADYPDLAPVAQLEQEVAQRTSDSIAVSEINLDPDRFQYKLGTDAGGVTPLLKKVEKWNPDLGKGISVWIDPADGKTYVVNGHHRVELAQRTGAKEILSPYYITADTAEEARVVGALQNIADGRGTPIDAAKFFRDTGLSPDDARAMGLTLSESTVKKGLALSTLHEGLFNAVVRGELPIERAVIIGERLPDVDMQFQLVQRLDKEMAKGRKITNDMVSELCDAMTAGPQATITQNTLFGMEATTQSYAFERADFLGYTKERLKKERKLFDFAAKNADNLERVGTIDKAASRDISQEAEQLLEMFDRMKNQKGRISDIANEAAAELGSGGNANKVKEEYYNRIVEALPEEISGMVAGTDTGSVYRAGGEGAAQAGFFGEEPLRQVGEPYGREAATVRAGSEAGAGEAQGIGAVSGGSPTGGAYDAPLRGAEAFPAELRTRFNQAVQELTEPAQNFLRDRGVHFSAASPADVTDPVMARFLDSAYGMTNGARDTIVFNADVPNSLAALAHETIHAIYPYIDEKALQSAGRIIEQSAANLLDAASKHPALSLVTDMMQDILRRGDMAEIVMFIERTNISDKQAEALKALAKSIGVEFEGTWDLEKLLFLGVGENINIPIYNYVDSVAEELLASQAIANGFDTQLFHSGYAGFQTDAKQFGIPAPGKKPDWLRKALDAGDQPMAHMADVSLELNQQAIDLLEQIKGDVGGRWGQGGLAAGVTDDVYKNMLKWLKEEWVPSFENMKSVAVREAQHRRDWALHNYSDRRNIDVLIHNIAPYFYWSSRTYPKWAMRFLEHPNALADYFRYRKLNEEKNKDLPEWYRQNLQVQLPGMDYPVFMNIEAMLNPVYQLTNSFQDRDRESTDTGRLFQQLADVGMMPWAPLVASYAMSRMAAGDQEGALAWQGYAAPTTRAIKAATSLAGIRGGQGITAEPWLWEGWDKGQPQAFTGMDKWDWRRVPKKVSEMSMAGDITPEQAAATQYSQQGPEWEQAQAMAISERAPGNMLGFLLGPSVRARTPTDVEIERADNEWREMNNLLYNTAEGLDIPPEERNKMYADFEQKYPWHASLRTGRSGDVGEMVTPEDGDSYRLKSRAERYAQDVIFRLPPGKPGTAIREQHLPQDLLNKWYDTGKTFRDWEQKDIDRFMSGVEGLGMEVLIPTPEQRALYEQVRGLKAERDAELKARYGADIFEVASRFPYNGTKEEKAAYMRGNPTLGDFWTDQQQLTEELGLTQWYGKDKTTDPQYQRARVLFGDDIWDVNSRYFEIRDSQGKAAAKNHLAAHPELKMLWSWQSGANDDWLQYAYKPARTSYSKSYGGRGGGGGGGNYIPPFPWWLIRKPWTSSVHWRW